MRICVVAGPVLLALSAALYTGRPSGFFLACGVAIALAIFACDQVLARARFGFWIRLGSYVGNLHLQDSSESRASIRLRQRSILRSLKSTSKKHVPTEPVMESNNENTRPSNRTPTTN